MQILSPDPKTENKNLTQKNEKTELEQFENFEKIENGYFMCFAINCY